MSGSASRRLGQIAAYLAAPLWALQAPIWIAAPKVQEQTVPYRITNPVLFELFWLSIAGAVAFSAAAARPMTRQVGGPFRGCRGCPPPSLSSTSGGGSAIERGWLDPNNQLFGQVTSQTRQQ